MLLFVLRVASCRCLCGLEPRVVQCDGGAAVAELCAKRMVFISLRPRPLGTRATLAGHLGQDRGSKPTDTRRSFAPSRLLGFWIGEGGREERHRDGVRSQLRSAPVQVYRRAPDLTQTMRALDLRAHERHFL